MKALLPRALPDLPDPGDVINPANPVVNGLAQTAGEAIVNYVIDAMYSLLAEAVAAITSALVRSFNGDSTRVDLTGGWFTTESGRTVTAMTSTIAGSLVLVLLLLALIRAMAAGEFSAMWRAALVDVPTAFLGTALTVTVAAALLAMVDEASAALLGSEGEQLAAFSQSLTDTEQLSGAGLLGMLFSLIFIVGAVLVWIQLLIRAALIYVVIAFAPITWVTRAYPGTRTIARRGIEIAVALIVSKFVMVVAFRLGAEALAASEVPAGEADLSAMLVGAATMTLTAFMPWLIFKVIPVVETATSAAGVDRSAAGTAVVAGTVAYAGVRRLAGSSSSGGTAGGGGATGDGSGGAGSTVPAAAQDGGGPGWGSSGGNPGGGADPGGPPGGGSGGGHSPRSPRQASTDPSSSGPASTGPNGSPGPSAQPVPGGGGPLSERPGPTRMGDGPQPSPGPISPAPAVNDGGATTPSLAHNGPGLTTPTGRTAARDPQPTTSPAASEAQANPAFTSPPPTAPRFADYGATT